MRPPGPSFSSRHWCHVNITLLFCLTFTLYHSVHTLVKSARVSRLSFLQYSYGRLSLVSIPVKAERLLYFVRGFDHGKIEEGCPPAILVIKITLEQLHSTSMNHFN